MSPHARETTGPTSPPCGATAAAAGARRARWRDLALLVALVVACVFLAHREALDAWFAADDFLWLELNTLDSVLASFTGPWGHGAAYRPLSRLSFFVDGTLFGLDARGWHAHSLLVHAAASVLLGWLVWRLAGERALALAVALLFALQPLGYQNTIWISGRSHPLAFALALLSLIFFDRYLLAARARDLVAAAGALAASLLTYEAGVYTLPFAMLVALLRRRRIRRRRDAVTGLLVLAVVTAAYLVLRRALVGSDPMYPTTPLADLLAGELALRLTAIATRLLAELGPWPWVVLGGVVVALWVARRYAVVALLGVVVALIGMLPFVAMTSYSVRFGYAAQAGVALIAAAAVCGVARVPLAGRALAAVLLALLLAGEWRMVRAASREWQQAGTVGKRALANLVAATPDPQADGVLFVAGTPRTHGRAMVFYTYLDAALRVFHPSYGRVAISAHYVTDLPPPAARAEVAAAWGRAQESRARVGRPPLRCADGPPELPGNGSFARLVDCNALVLALDPQTQRATPSSDTRLRARLGRL